MNCRCQWVSTEDLFGFPEVVGVVLIGDRQMFVSGPVETVLRLLAEVRSLALREGEPNLPLALLRGWN